MERPSITVGDRLVPRAADMRYVAQEHAVTVDISRHYFSEQDRDGIKAEFDRVHEIRYGTSAPAEKAEIVSLRCAVTGRMQKPPLEQHLLRGDDIPAAAKTGLRPIYFSPDSGFTDTPSYARPGLLSGNRIAGPAVIEEHASTTVIFPGDELTVDGYGNLLISVGKVAP